MSRSEDLLVEVQERLKNLEHQAELIKTVLIVKEPGTVQASQAFDGLRKQIVASAAERRSHLMQLVAMAVAVNRATSLEDLRPQVEEWLQQANVALLLDAAGNDPSHVFEDIGGEGLDGAIEVVEPAFVDVQTQSVLRLGRARRAGGPPADDGPGEPEAADEEPASPEEETQ